LTPVVPQLLLPDLNVLVALAWPNHQFHAAAISRMNRSDEPWATCVITQLGFIRLSSTPALVGIKTTPAEARYLLARLTDHPRHRYLDTLPGPLTDTFGQYVTRIYGHQQVNDAYLLALAKEHSATLVTFDARIAAFADSRDEIDVLGEL